MTATGTAYTRAARRSSIPEWIMGMDVELYGEHVDAATYVTTIECEDMPIPGGRTCLDVRVYEITRALGVGIVDRGLAVELCAVDLRLSGEPAAVVWGANRDRLTYEARAALHGHCRRERL